MANLKSTILLLVWVLLQALTAVFAQSEEQVMLQAEAEPDYNAALPLLRQYVGQALERNPSIQEVLARYRAALQSVPQVTALPDPVFGFSRAIRSVETRVGPQNNGFVLSPAFPLDRKTGSESQSGCWEAASWYQLRGALQRELISQLKRAFYQLGYIDTTIQINEEERSLLEHHEGLTQRRYATGQALQQAEITRIIERLKSPQRQRVTLSSNINTPMDCPPHTRYPVWNG
jgi:outer membrane protein TolC